MCAAPEPARGVEDVPTAHEHLHEPMTAAPEVRADVFATATEIANRLLLGRGGRDHRQHARGVQFHELARITTVRLDSLAGFARDQRRRDDLAHNSARGLEPPLKRVAAWPRLVANPDLAICSALKAANELADRFLLVVDRELLRLALARMDHRDHQRLLVRVDSDPRDRSVHDRLPSLAALAQANPRYCRSA